MMGTPIGKGKKTKLRRVIDGFTNFSQRLGVNPAVQNNTISDSFYSFNLITRNRIQLEAAYRGSWLVGQVIDCVSEDMTRAGIEITTNENPENIVKLQRKMSRLQVWDRLCYLVKIGRLYGGAIAVFQIDGQKLDTPLNMDSVGKGQFKGITCYDRWQLNPDLTNLITEGPELGLPEYYYIVLGNDSGNLSTASTPTGQVKVHHSRCIRMIGIELPFFQAITEMMWGESYLERLWDRLLAFDDTTMNVANLVDRASLRVIKVDKLREVISNGGAGYEGMIAFFENVRQFQSNEGLTLLDKEDEFTNPQYNFGGLPDILLQFGQQVSGAAQIPLVRLFGQSPAGMSSTGESDIRNYYDSINAQQESRLRLPMEKLISIMYRSEFGVPTPEDLEFSFAPLWQMNDKDKAELAAQNTDTTVKAFTEALIDRATAMEELRDQSSKTGLFANISDESIEEAKTEEPPMPNEGELGSNNMKGPKDVNP